MFEILDETEEDLVAVRVGRGTPHGYDELYSLLSRKTERYGTVRVYEEVPEWTFLTFLSHLHGLIPDLQYGSRIKISRYAAVGDSVWAKLLFDWWRTIRPIWPVAPNQMRYWNLKNQSSALRWVRSDE